MKVKIRRYADFETESVRIEIGDSEFLLKEKAYGFEIKKDFYQKACKLLEENVQPQLF